MKLILSVLLLTSFSAHANLCARYEAGSEKAKALSSLVKQTGRTLEEICLSPRILDIEIQPSQVIVGGEIIPQWAIFFHYNEESCKYMLNRSDLVISSSKCFPTW